MELVVTLIASDTLEPALAAQVVGALNARCAERLDARATDIFIDGEIHPTRRIVERTLADAPVDFVVQPRADRRKQLLLSDMDSTLIEQECIDELAAELGLKARVSAITERAMRGELDFESALTSRVALLKGIGESAIDKILQSAITLTPGAAAMTRTLKANGIRTVLVSGGFTQFAGPIAERLGMDAHHANRLLAAEGLLTGALAQPILGADAKRERLQAECAALGIPLTQSAALGDGANDLPMIQSAGLGIAWRAKPQVRTAADAALEHTDLSAVCYALGCIPEAAASGT